MGVKGRRPEKCVHIEKFEEPQLIVKVEDIIKNSNYDNKISDKANVDVAAIAKSNDIDITYEIMDSYQSGYLQNIDDRWVIGVNRLHNPKRQRFTIAHELGHYFMHRDKNLNFEDATFFRNENNSSIEYAANEFAGRLLMPEDRLRDAVSSGMKSLEKLANLFEVSTTAIKYRVSSLGYKIKGHE